MQHRLMIIGSLYENIALVQEAKKRGIYTIVCDGYKNGHSKNIADKSYDIDIRNTDAIAEICLKENVDGIVGSFSDIVFEKVTEIAAKAKLKWYVKPEKLKYYRDKKIAKDLLRTLGVSVPNNKIINVNFSDSDVSGMNFPLVVKPVNGWGSKGIYVVNNIGELKHYSMMTSNLSGSDRVLIEEYSKGNEYNITAFLTDGVVNVISCGHREKSPSKNHEIPKLKRIYYPINKDYDIIEAARITLQKFSDATEQKYGVLSMQCFFYNGILTVCEIAGRILAYENDIIGRHSGINIPSLLIDCVYNSQKYKDTIAHSKQYIPSEIYSRLYFFAYDNYIIKNMDNVFHLCEFDKLTDNIIFYNEGDVVDNNSYRSYFATFSFVSKSINELDEITDYFSRNLMVYSENGENIIYSN